MMPDVPTIPRARIVGLAAVALAAFGLAFAATHAGRGATGSAGEAPALQLERPTGGGVPDSLSAVAAIPVLARTPAPSPRPTATGTSTTGTTPAPTAAAPAAPFVSAPEPAPAAPPAAAPAPAPAPGVPFDDSG